jgi:hypothetical protein
MKLKTIVILSLAILLSLSLSAQKKKKRIVKKPVVEEPQEDPRITNMREMTQNILIIDSIVADKDNYLDYFVLSGETGSIISGDVFSGRKDSITAFMNEMGNKLYYSKPDINKRQQLITSDLLGEKWSKDERLEGISEGISEAAYPFMLNDGITLYFAGKGEESIGGYDIFMTRYDARSGKFFKPENIGMPFNSESNDYLYAVDETHRIGYFVSDRRQPQGKVCIYVFVPSDTRKTYDPSIYTEQQIRDFADIKRISDTWGDSNERDVAYKRWKNIEISMKRESDSLKLVTANADDIIVINNALTYKKAEDFRSKGAEKIYKQLVAARKQQRRLSRELDSARDDYQKASKADRKGLRREILQGEKQLEESYRQVEKLEKETRNMEIMVIR